jgi:hypothetical protein
MMKSPEDDDVMKKKQKEVTLRYRTAKLLFPAVSVPRGVVWAWRQTLCTARCGMVPHTAVQHTAG